MTVQTQPATQTCTVNNGNGTITNADVTNVTVQCSTNFYTVGANVSGLASSESLVLQNNNADDLPLAANGAFTFPVAVAEGTTYNVTVLTQPSTQTCIVTNGSGTMGGANVTNVAVNCTYNPITLTSSLPSGTDLALSITGITEYGVPGTPASGVSRVITITNSGPYDAINFSVTYAYRYLRHLNYLDARQFLHHTN